MYVNFEVGHSFCSPVYFQSDPIMLFKIQNKFSFHGYTWKRFEVNCEENIEEI